jgi:hypothetical protein
LSSGSNKNRHCGRGPETLPGLIGLWVVGLALAICLGTAASVSAEKTGDGRRYAFQFEGNRAVSATALRRSASAELDAFVQNGGREADLEDAVFQMEITYRGEGYAFAAVSYTGPSARIWCKPFLRSSKGPVCWLITSNSRGAPPYRPMIWRPFSPHRS